MCDRPDSLREISSSYHDSDLSTIVEPTRRVLSRRAALKGVALLGLAGAVTTLLAACSVPSGNSSNDGTPTPDSGGDAGSDSNSSGSSNGSSSGSDNDNNDDNNSSSSSSGDDSGGDDSGGSSAGGDGGE